MTFFSSHGQSQRSVLSPPRPPTPRCPYFYFHRLWLTSHLTICILHHIGAIPWPSRPFELVCGPNRPVLCRQPLDALQAHYLTSVAFTNCEFLTPSQFYSLIAPLRQLLHLSIAGAVKIGPLDLTLTLFDHIQLQSLDISFTKASLPKSLTRELFKTPSMLIWLDTRLLNLRHLALNGWDELEISTLAAPLGSRLESLSVKRQKLHFHPDEDLEWLLDDNESLGMFSNLKSLALAVSSEDYEPFESYIFLFNA